MGSVTSYASKSTPVQPIPAASLLKGPVDHAINAEEARTRISGDPPYAVWKLRERIQAEMQLKSEQRHGIISYPDAAVFVHAFENSDSGKFSSGDLAALVSAGIIIVLCDALADENVHSTDATLAFFLWYTLVQLLMGIHGSVTDNKVLLHVISELAIEPWRALWNSRADIQDRCIVGFEGQDEPLLLTITSTLMLVTQIRSLSQQISTSTLPTLRASDPAVQLAFFVWMDVSKCAEVDYCPKIFSEAYLNDDDDLKSLHMAQIVDLYDAQTVVLRLKHELVALTHSASNGEPASDYFDALLTTTMCFIPGACASSACASHLTSSGIFDASLALHMVFSELCLAKAWDESEDVREIGRLTAWSGTVAIFMAIDTLHMGPQGTPGAYLTLNPDQIAMVFLRCLHVLNPQNVRALSAKHIAKLERVFSTHPATSAPRPILDALRAAQTQTTWYYHLNGVKALQAKHHNQPSAQLVKSIERHWLSWGKALGVNEASARKEYERQKTLYCCWPECPFYTTPANKPLFACRGCGEFRYCSKEHQRRAWKEGGHRRQCRRLPAP